MSPDRARARAAYCLVSRPWLRESAWVARFRAVQNFPTQFQGLKHRLIRLPLRGSLRLIRADCDLGRASGQSLCLAKSALICRYVRLRLETQAAALGVASYTPGLVTAQDGSVSIVIGGGQAKGIPQAIWLPIPNGPFSLMLRAYGPNWDQQNTS